VWLDDGEAPPRRGTSAVRRILGTIAALACVAVIGVPVGLVLTSATSRSTSPARLATGPAEHRVLTALSVTIDSGSFNMTFSDQAPTAPSSAPTTCPSLSPVAPLTSGPAKLQDTNGCGYLAQGLTISGQGTIDTNPFAMVAMSNVPGIGSVTARANGTDVWEIGGGNYGLSPGSSSTGPGSPLSGFADLVEGTLGPRQGALAMMGLANPTGYLQLDQNAITSANPAGTGAVDGVPVTIYHVAIDPAQQANVPGATPEEGTAIRNALDVLRQQGYTGTSAKVSIDGAGYIRQTVLVASFADGVTQTSEATLSDFGCAGRVLMPGQSGPTSPPAGCTSPATASSTSSGTPSTS
jgi:hypothetical protein